CGVLHDDGAGLRERLPRRHPAPHSLFLVVLACARHHLGWHFHGGLSLRSLSVSDLTEASDTAPGDQAAEKHELGGGVAGYTLGLGLATLLTIMAFALPTLNLVWAPSLPIALAV